MMHESNLSSAQTFAAKFVFPAFWISALGFGTLSSWFSTTPNGRHAQPPDTKFIFLGIWILGSALILWTMAGLKRVRIDGQQLLVSNYFRELSIPISAIVDVRQNCWLNHRPITIYFADATEFGNQVTFIPKWRFRILFWCEDPVVDDLRQMARLTHCF